MVLRHVKNVAAQGRLCQTAELRQTADERQVDARGRQAPRCVLKAQVRRFQTRL